MHDLEAIRGKYGRGGNFPVANCCWTYKRVLKKVENKFGRRDLGSDTPITRHECEWRGVKKVG